MVVLNTNAFVNQNLNKINKPEQLQLYDDLKNSTNKQT